MNRNRFGVLVSVASLAAALTWSATAPVSAEDAPPRPLQPPAQPAQPGQPTQPAPNGGAPDFTCCEANIRIDETKKGGPIYQVIETKTDVVADSWRAVAVTVRFPIHFDCPQNLQKRCIGKFIPTLTSEPTQGGAAPMDSKVLVTKWADHECNGALNIAGNVDVTYRAIYKGTGDVAGALAFNLSTLDPRTKVQKGNDYTFKVDLSTDGKTVKTEGAELKKSER